MSAEVFENVSCLLSTKGKGCEIVNQLDTRTIAFRAKSATLHEGRRVQLIVRSTIHSRAGYIDWSSQE